MGSPGEASLPDSTKKPGRLAGLDDFWSAVSDRRNGLMGR